MIPKSGARFLTDLLVQSIGHFSVEDQPDLMNRVCREGDDLGVIVRIGMVFVRLELQKLESRSSGQISLEWEVDVGKRVKKNGEPTLTSTI
jgi:hypothetical protein